MTTEEAIKQLEYDKAMCLFNPMTGEEEPMNEDCRKSAEADELAINALKKQIPMKPIHVRTFENLDLAFYKCPNCGFIRRKDLFPQYCEFCGQAIDRSEL